MPGTLEKLYTWVAWVSGGNGNQEIVDFYFKTGLMNVAKALLRRRLADDKEHPLLVKAVRRHPQCPQSPVSLHVCAHVP